MDSDERPLMTHTCWVSSEVEVRLFKHDKNSVGGHTRCAPSKWLTMAHRPGMRNLFSGSEDEEEDPVHYTPTRRSPARGEIQVGREKHRVTTKCVLI